VSFSLENNSCDLFSFPAGQSYLKIINITAIFKKLKPTQMADKPKIGMANNINNLDSI